MIYLTAGHPSVESLRAQGVAITDSAAPAGCRRIGILNLMPQKQEAEEEYYLMMDGAGVDLEIVLLKMSGLKYKTTPQEYMDRYYTDIASVMESGRTFDGLIITGAPLEQYAYDEVTYWQQLNEVYRWTFAHVCSTLNICWGAFAALKIFFGIDKHWTDEKLFGLFRHRKCGEAPLLSGLPEELMVPISRQITLRREELVAESQLTILLDQPTTGPELALAWQGRHIFANGHLEYREGRLRFEYERDLAKGLPIGVPANYFVDNNPALGVNECWRSNGRVFYANWLKHYVCNEGLAISVDLGSLQNNLRYERD